ncbi:MAG: DUF6178 family protein [Nitrospinaceae bacterium]
MNPKEPSLERLPDAGLPFPAAWIDSDPRKVEAIFSEMPVEDQARLVMRLEGAQRQKLLLLSRNSVQVTRALPPEDVYLMIKELGDSSALSVLSMMSEEQVQFVFDVEWWDGDRFVPKRALEWLTRLDQCDEPQVLNWLGTEEFDQKVMVFQSFIKVFKYDEMTDSFENTEGLPHFSPDGVYEIFFKVRAYDPIKKILLLLHSEDPSLFMSLMEAVIWYPLTQTVEKAWRWRLVRTSARGIPEFEEAFEVYSRVDPSALQLGGPSPEDFMEKGESRLPPQYPLTHYDSSTFFGRCMARLQDTTRMDAIRWELAVLFNKVLVADRLDPSSLEDRNRIVKKVLGYCNIGLETSAGGDVLKGAKLLQRTWLQFLFQAGYHQVMKLKWKAETFLNDAGPLLKYLTAQGDQDQLVALIGRFPQVGEFMMPGEPLQWRDFESVGDVQKIETYLRRWAFYLRFAKKGLELSETKIDRFLNECNFPENKEDVNLLGWVTMALARFTLFQEIACEPLSEVAARSFLEMIFLQRIYKDNAGTCREEIIQAFHQRLLQTAMAWTEEDRHFLAGLIQECVANLESHFGRLNPKGKIEWKFTRGLCIRAE